MIEFFLGLSFGILLMIVAAPFLVKRYISKRMNYLTGGLFVQ